MNEVTQDIQLWIDCGKKAEKLGLKVEIYNYGFAVRREEDHFLAYPKSLIEVQAFLHGYSRGIHFSEEGL